MRVLAFTGMPGSGKSAAAEVARSLGIPVVRMGDSVWAEVRARDLPLTDAQVGKVAQEMRALHGPAIWAERTLERIRALGAERVAIDGVRSVAEVDAFKAALGHDFVLVALLASGDRRHARLLARAREDEAVSRQEADERDRRELAWGIAEVIARADVTLHNEGDDKAGFLDEVRRVLEGA